MSGTVSLPPAAPQRRSGRCVLTPLGTPWRAIDGLLLQHAPACLIVPRAEDGLRHRLCGHAQLLRTESIAPLGMRGSSSMENFQAAPADIESSVQVLPASAPSGQAMYSSMVTGSLPRRLVTHGGGDKTQQRTLQQVWLSYELKLYKSRN